MSLEPCTADVLVWCRPHSTTAHLSLNFFDSSQRPVVVPGDLLTVSIATAAAAPTSLLPAISPWLRSSTMLSLGSSPGSSAGGLPPQTRGPKPQGGLTVRGRKFPVEDKAMRGTSSTVICVTDLTSPLRPWAPFTTGSSHREALAVWMEPSSVVGTGTSTTVGASRGSRSWAADGHRCPRDALVA
ncbi:uncharacterized protein LOC124686926 [Lolium rigidum]|uniref:uncharacterized protein LOC124686926 n=1 Tax=Lolium rigidum TaxID=89674 RepID=UPI001F5C48EE|nr:uncharacterized protein LOC124686926 [Lolium rigidum]